MLRSSFVISPTCKDAPESLFWTKQPIYTFRGEIPVRAVVHSLFLYSEGYSAKAMPRIVGFGGAERTTDPLDMR